MAAITEFEKVVHMHEGEGETKHFRKSIYQTNVILKARPVLEESVSELLRSMNLEDQCLRMAEMGCSTGPNTLLPLREVIETVDSTCGELHKKPPVLQVFLNDLPGNDFNTIFKSLVPEFQEKLEKEMGKRIQHCYIAAMAGSFYGRLFPANFLHFGHSYSSLHWISQVPEGLVSESGISLNKATICYAEWSTPSVHKAYLSQFSQRF